MTKPKKLPKPTAEEMAELEAAILERKDVSAEVLGEAIGPLPLLSIIRMNFEGLVEEHTRRIEGAVMQLKDPSYKFLKDGVDPLKFIVDSAKYLAQCELMLEFDRKARKLLEENSG